MKKVLFIITIICGLTANAQNYLINFAGTGASTVVKTVKVENLTATTSLTLNENDILRLTGTVDITQVENERSSGLKIYPNPTTNNSTLEFFPPVAGEVTISVFDITGKQVAKFKSYLENSLQVFRLSGINRGLYLISVKGGTFIYSGKLLCNGKSNGEIIVERISNNGTGYEKITKTDSKGIQATVDMPYSAGDRLKFTGTSGIYSTVITDIPASDKTITFNFIACTDGENNNYPVVQIGTQVWMAGNLNTTKYNDGTAIPFNSTSWLSLVSPAYDTMSIDIYGAFYNWYAVNTGSLCPTGWHVPGTAEWTTLMTDLGGTTIAGGKLKETGTVHWRIPNTGATDEIGFSALPGGNRQRNSGSFINIGDYGFWWSATEINSNNATVPSLWYNNGSVIFNSSPKNNGFPVRCVKD